MSAEPVAWQVDYRSGRVSICVSEEDMLEVKHEIDAGHLRATLTPLYSESPAQARALAIQEAARVCERMTERWVRRHSSGAMGQMCGLGEGTASDCVEAIRALSPAPSVTEEWVNTVASDSQFYDSFTVASAAVRATLAALGVTVEGAAK